MATALLALGDRPEDKLPRIAVPVLVSTATAMPLPPAIGPNRCARLAPDGRLSLFQAPRMQRTSRTLDRWRDSFYRSSRTC